MDLISVKQAVVIFTFPQGGRQSAKAGRRGTPLDLWLVSTSGNQSLSSFFFAASSAASFA